MASCGFDAGGNESHNDLILGNLSQLFHRPAFIGTNLVNSFHITSVLHKSYQFFFCYFIHSKANLNSSPTASTLPVRAVTTSHCMVVRGLTWNPPEWKTDSMV